MNIEPIIALILQMSEKKVLREFELLVYEQACITLEKLFKEYNSVQFEDYAE